MVTAGTGGIGLETALGLAAAGFAVTVVGRDAERGARAVERINAARPAYPGRFLAADLASLDQVRALAHGIAADHAASGEPLTVRPLVRRRFEQSTSGPVSAAARSSIAAATDPVLTGRTGLVIGPRRPPVAPFRAATDRRIAEAVHLLSRTHAPAVAG
ncbi:hypothetical protein Aph01nite_36260 [Acrocarpospora phusangensis]|uniref:Uncharacterized protein n=1 Tax=Acrocarpospora phusangensis TaxID=1070424 RepID=A0A919QAM4_9ACTN|nr:hypothetical protein Aph01nite_36260 [Acrocarpospora phusangensis]